MLTISKPLSASQARTYHVRECASQEQNYWSRDQQGHSEWQGRLAEQWGLQGNVGSEHFARLSGGQHPHTEEQLVRHQVSRTYEGKFGREVTSAEHRAGWDATFSAPKSVSLTALVAAMIGSGKPIGRVYARRFRNLNDTRRRGSAMSMPQRRPANSSPPLSSTIPRGLSMAMLRPSFILMP